jgi:Asparagine synthase
LILTTLLEPRTLQRGFFNEAGVRKMLDEHFRGRTSHWSRIWRLLMFELWHREYHERAAAPQPIGCERAV